MGGASTGSSQTNLFTIQFAYDEFIFIFVPYLMTLSAPPTVHRQMIGKNELQSMSEGAIVAQMRALSWQSPGRAEDNQEKPQSEQSLSRPGLGQGT